MNQQEVAYPRVVDCAGFRIEIDAERLKVSKSGSSPNAGGKRSIGSYVIHGILLLAVGIKTLSELGRFIHYLASLAHIGDIFLSDARWTDRIADAFPLLLPLLFGWLIYALYLSQQRRGYYDLECTREQFQILHKVRGQLQSTQTFARTEMRQIQFAGFNRWYDWKACGLTFTCNGKLVKLLEGLQCVEAQTILNELERLGYNIHRDVGMPMAVEMAKEARNSWFS